METTTLKNGHLVEHNDVIIHTTTTYLSRMDKLRILFGKPVVVTSRIYTKHEDAMVTGSEAYLSYVPDLFPKKSVGMIQMDENYLNPAG